MSKKRFKIMVINWDWSDKLEFPNGIVEKNENSELSFRFSKDLRFIDVLNQEKIKEVTDPETGNPLCIYIVPIKVNLSYHIDVSPVVLKLCIERLLDEIIEKKGKVNQYDIEILLHRNDGFDKINQVLDTIIPYQKEKLMDIVIGYFGKGIDRIYQDGGLIMDGPYFFQYKEDEGLAGYFTETYKPEYIFESNFDFVWNHHWYKTKDRLREFRSLLTLAQIPIEDKVGLKKQALDYTKHLLYNWKKDLNLEDFKTLPWLEQDLSKSQDLDYWLGGGNPKFNEEDRETFLKELKAFKALEIKSFDNFDFGPLNTSLEKVIESLYS